MKRRNNLNQRRKLKHRQRVSAFSSTLLDSERVTEILQTDREVDGDESM